jgi:hypothetical protein
MPRKHVSQMDEDEIDFCQQLARAACTKILFYGVQRSMSAHAKERLNGKNHGNGYGHVEDHEWLIKPSDIENCVRRFSQVVEFKYHDDRDSVTLVVRDRHGICLVVGLEGRIVSCYHNDPTDNHRSLNPEEYDASMDIRSYVKE